MYTKKYLFDSAMKKKYIGASIALWVILSLSAVCLISTLMHLAPIDSDSDKSIGLSASVLWFVVMVISLRPLARSAYSYDIMRLKYTYGSKISVFSSKRRYYADLQTPFFFCRIPVYFLFKQHDHVQCFYLFSNVPLSKGIARKDGVEAVYQIFSEGGILVPESDEMKQWISTELNLPTFPVFPRFGYHPGIRVDGKEMHDGIG